jgi:hypothetical protein
MNLWSYSQRKTELLKKIRAKGNDSERYANEVDQTVDGYMNTQRLICTIPDHSYEASRTYVTFSKSFILYGELTFSTSPRTPSSSLWDTLGHAAAISRWYSFPFSLIPALARF